MQKRKPDPKKYCRQCKSKLHRKVLNGGRLEDMTCFRKRHYCDRICMALGMAKQEVCKATYHTRARKHKKPNCERCGAADNLAVHHKDGDWKNNEPDNLETVCLQCHNKQHGPERGELFSKRQWIERDRLAEIWATLKAMYEHLLSLGEAGPKELIAQVEDVLHRGGQL